MQILNIMQCTNLGGMEQASLRLMKGLQGHGHTCRVLSLNALGELACLLENAGVSAEGLAYRGKGGWRSFPNLRRELRQEEADALIMTGHNLLASLALGGLCDGRRLLAIHFHHAGVKPVWQWRLIYQVARKKFCAVTYPSDYIRKEAEAIYPPISAISHTVRNPLPINQIPSKMERSNARLTLGVRAECQLVGNAGWLIQRKRFDVFLNVAKIVAQHNCDVEFVIAGDGPLREELGALAEKLGIAHRIHWLGWQKDMTSFYQSLNVLMFNSDWDALPTTPLEAMSYGIPVVASVVNGGLREVICDKTMGILFDQHDVPKLAEGVLQTLSQQSTELGEVSRNRIHSLCNPETVVSQVERLLGLR